MKRFFNLALIFFSAVLSVSAANVFYVSTDGSDADDGTQNAPFATIQKAADTANAGDTVKVAAGIYTAQNAAPNRGMIFFRRAI